MLEDLVFLLLQAAGAITFLCIVLLLAYMYATTERQPLIKCYDGEESFVDPTNNERASFPSIFDSSSIYLSVVIPAYNEQERLPAMLDEALEYLERKSSSRKSFTYEVIVIDDGSKDNTTQVAMKYCKKYGIEKFRVLTLQENRGKGGAVKMGVIHSRGTLILFADADGATTFDDLEKLEDNVTQNMSRGSDLVVCGSRAHLEEEAIAERSLFRTLLMKGFHFLVWFLLVRGVRDTQCGFKLMTRSAARKLFTNLHINRWAFDVELLYMAQALNMTITEVAVRWKEIEGSKLVPFWSWLQMGRDLLFIRLRYLVGLWQIKNTD